jgi:hypothetical protein
MARLGWAVWVTVVLASSASGREFSREELDEMAMKSPKWIQQPVVTVVEVARNIDRRVAAAFREYVARERPASCSAFECFKLVPAKNMREARTMASELGVPFILRIQFLRRVVGSTWKDANTGEMVDCYNCDLRLEIWAPNKSRAAPKGSWKMKTRCLTRNYNRKTPGMGLMDMGVSDPTDKPDMPADFGMIGDRILGYLRRSVLEVKKVRVEKAPDDGTSTRVDVVNHASVPITHFSLRFGRGISDVSYDGEPVPPGDSSVSVPPSPMRSPGRDRTPPAGPFKGRVSFLSFGMETKPKAFKDKATDKIEHKP